MILVLWAGADALLVGQGGKGWGPLQLLSGRAEKPVPQHARSSSVLHGH